MLGASLTCNQDPGTTSYSLYIFDSEPNNNADADAVLLLAADYPKIVGVFHFIQTDKETTASTTVTFRSVFQARRHTYSTRSGSLYGLLQVSLGTPTPVSAAIFCLRLSLEVDDRLSSAGE